MTEEGLQRYLDDTPIIPTVMKDHAYTNCDQWLNHEDTLFSLFSKMQSSMNLYYSALDEYLELV